MKFSFHAGLLALILFATATAPARGDSRMQVSVGSTPIFAQASADAQKVGNATSGEILFVSRIEGDWAAISPPDRLDLWLNKDFIEGNRVVAKSIQIRSGPGVQYGVVGSLERGAPVMPRGEDGDWCKIAPPSSTTLWVKKSDLSEVQARSTPIQEVAPVPEPPKPAPATASTPKPTPAPPPPPPAQAAADAAPAPQPPASKPPTAAIASTPAPAPASTPRPARRVAPSVPNASAPTTPKPAPVSAPVASVAAPARPAATVAAPAPRPAPATASAPAATTLRPATSLPGQIQTRPAATTLPAQRQPATPPVAKIAPSASGAGTTQKPRNPDVQVDQAYVDQLDLEDLPNQGKPVQVEGELRNAPFMAGTPSRYRLQARDEDGVLEMVCHVHGDSALLRPYVGKNVSIRGREYWVEESDMPVVVVGQIAPLAPAGDEDEPVMF